MKKYLIIGNGNSPHILKWIKALKAHFEVYLLSSENVHKDLQDLLPPYRIFTLNLDVSPEGGNYRILFRLWKITGILKRIQPDIVNAHYITSHGFIAALVKRFTTLDFYLVQSAWGSDILVAPFRNKVYKAITRFSLRTADLATSDSLHMTRILESIHPVETLTFTFGLDTLPAFDPEEKDDFLFFSNRILSDNYNIDEVIRFFNRITQEESRARLVIANNGPDRKILEEQVRSLQLTKQVDFVGFLTEKEQTTIYRKARFYISIPASDATSVSLLEAMAYGCIPIVSDIPANQEWINDGENGVYYRTETGYKTLEKLLEQSSGIAELNRAIIRERAIFPDSINQYVQEIAQRMETQKRG